MNLNTYLENRISQINRSLDQLMPAKNEPPFRIHEAMRYSLFAGGKRLRPVLCIAACEACNGTTIQAINAACAIELLHTYTLIHDDLPAMDNDTLRRGKPTCHIQFDEATAILAGDSLLTLCFETLAQIPDIGTTLTLELARASGSRGIIKGQAEDLAAEGKPPDATTVETIHRCKTAALIRAAFVMGGLCAHTNTHNMELLARCGEETGLAFQITDDMLDETSTVEELGKDIGSDRKNKKMTWTTVHGTKAARIETGRLTRSACKIASSLPNGKHLQEIIEKMLERKS
jgi:geranylgeranyl diphosphate synthase type II